MIINKTGPFSDCLTTVESRGYYQSCVFDACAVGKDEVTRVNLYHCFISFELTLTLFPH